MSSLGIESPDLDKLLKNLHLPTVRHDYKECADKATQEGLSYEEFLFELIERECEVRHHNKIARNLRDSRLSLEKNLDLFDLKRLPDKVQKRECCEIKSYKKEC